MILNFRVEVSGYSPSNRPRPLPVPSVFQSDEKQTGIEDGNQSGPYAPGSIELKILKERMTMNKFFLRSAFAAVLVFTASQALAQTDMLLMHNPRTIWQGSQDRINQNFRYWQAKNGASCGSQCGSQCGTGRDIADSLGCNDGCGTGCNSGWQKLSGKSIWANYVGRTGDFENDFGFGYDIKSNGVQAGLDLFSDRCTQFGVMFGYERETSYASLDYERQIRTESDTKADDYYFGFYFARQLRNCFDVRGYIGYGHQNYDAAQSTYDLLTGVRIGHIAASLTGDTFESTLELGRRCYLNRHLSYRPVIALDIFNNHITEDDADADMGLTQLFARFGSDLQWTRGRLNLNGGAYYSYQMNGAGRNAGFGGILPMDIFLGGSVFTLTAGTTYYLNQAQTFGVFANYYGDAYVDAAGSPWQHTFLVGGQYRF